MKINVLSLFIIEISIVMLITFHYAVEIHRETSSAQADIRRKLYYRGRTFTFPTGLACVKVCCMCSAFH
jgi:hypothetical protein